MSGKFFKPDIEKMEKNRDIKGLIKAMDYPDIAVALRAREALVRIGGPAVETLIKALKDQKWKVRHNVITVLGTIGDKRSVEPLIQALKDESWDVRRLAARALGAIGDARAVEPLIQALTNKDSNVRIDVVKALGEIGDARTVEPLIQALKDRNLDVQWAAVDVLTKIGDPAVESLTRALEKENAGVLAKISLDKIVAKKPKEVKMHVSRFANKLRCPCCGKVHGTKEWPVNGDRVAFYFQKEPGRYTLKVTCPHCEKDWYVVWDDDPGRSSARSLYIIEMRACMRVG